LKEPKGSFAEDYETTTAENSPPSRSMLAEELE
jgi:hypothetical protein